MADNYLEKRMEDYRKGTLRTAYKKRITPTGLPAGMVCFEAGQQRVAVAVTDNNLRDTLIEAITRTGLHTAFFGNDRAEGNATAQRTGSLFCPVDSLSPTDINKGIETVAKRWNGIDVIVTDINSINTVGIKEIRLMQDISADTTGTTVEITENAAMTDIVDAVLYAIARHPRTIRI